MAAIPQKHLMQEVAATDMCALPKRARPPSSARGKSPPGHNHLCSGKEGETASHVGAAQHDEQATREGSWVLSSRADCREGQPHAPVQ